MFHTRIIHHSVQRPSIAGWLLGLVLAVSVQVAVAQPDEHVEEYLTRDEALQEVFPDAVEWIPQYITLSEAEWTKAKEELHRKLPSDSVEIFFAFDKQKKFAGYAVISDEKGKYRPITYIVGVNPDLRVRKVAIMVYREDRGAEVRRPRFLYQYEDKRLSDPIRTNRDIMNISGATISVRSINAGVKKVLYLLGQRFVPGQSQTYPVSQPNVESPDHD